MDCDNARLYLPFLTPGGKDLDGAEAAELHAHLEQCTACNAQAMNANRIDQSLGRAMRAVPVPAGMKERLLERLAEERGALRRRWLRGGGLVAAAAAVLLLAMGVGFFLRWDQQQHAQIDPERALEPVSLSGHDSESVERAFRQLGASRAVAPNYRYEFLVGDPAMVDLPGHEKVRVPQLVFVDPPAIPLLDEREALKRDGGQGVRPRARRAIVYVLPPNRHKVNPEKVVPHEEYRYNFFYDKNEKGWECLILYDGKDWRWLLPKEKDDA